MKINKLKGLRAMLGITQKEMAELLELSSQQRYSQKENGQSDFKRSEMKTIKEFFSSKFKRDMSVDEIFF